MNDDRFDPENRVGTDYTEPAGETFHTQQPPHPPVGSSPSETDPAQCPELPPAGRPRKPGDAMKAIMLVVSVVILIIASALVFMQEPVVFQPPSGGETVGSAPEKSPGVTEDDGPQIDGVVSGVNSIPRYEAEPGLSMTLAPQPEGEPLSLTQIYAKCAPSVVAITADMTDASGYSWGTGIIMTEDGYVITNAHVLDGASAVEVTLYDDTAYEARLVGSDSQSDLAVLKLIGAEGLTPAEFGDSSTLEVGEDVVAIGNPLGEELRGTMTNGIVSAINRDISYNGHTMTLLQTNAAINEGNSGGPLINMYGQVIGVTNMKMISYYTSIEGIGFAIPSASAKTIVDQLLELGKVLGRPGIGVTITTLTQAERDQYGLPAGLYVKDINEKSDAYTQGIRIGDTITEVNGQAVYSTDQVNAVKDSLQVGDTMTVTIWRSGEELEITFRLMDMTELF